MATSIRSASFVLAVLVEGALGAAPVPYALECEARANPLGIETAAPRLSWKLKSAERGQRQIAYQVQAATDPGALAAGRAGLWDSGRVNSAETAWIPYRGARLLPYQRVWWKVRVWGVTGEPSAWSDPAEWTMSVLDPDRWKASWIASPDSALRAAPLPLFRKEIVVDRPLRRALVSVSGMGFYSLRIDGREVGDHVLAPAWTNFRQTALYETFDVTAMLASGANVLGALLGNGFYNEMGGRYAKYTASFGRPRLFLELHLEFQDGTARDVGTDSSWRVHDGPVTFASMYGGEDFDARLEPHGWDRPGFDDSSWRPAAQVAAGVLRAQSSPPVRVQRTFRAARVTNPRPGVYIYDFGQNFAGRPKLTVSGPAGAVVRLTPGELLDESGMVTQRSSGGPSYFAYTLAGTGRETWAPRFSYSGFRYIEVEGAAPDNAAPSAGVPAIHDLEGGFLHLDAARTGRFSCSNVLFNRIHELVDAAVRSNLQHVVTDCPHREKLGWLEVPYLLGPALLYDWDLRTYLPKIVRDTREAQTIDGLFPDVAPEYSFHAGGFHDSPEWGSAGILLPWMIWQWYGNRQPVEDSYRAMERYSEYLAAKSTGHLLVHGLGDWYDIGPGTPGASKLTPKGLTATATYFADLRALESAARLLGHVDDARRFAAQAAIVREAFQSAFYHSDRKTYATGSQTSLAMPLVLGLAPEGARPDLVEQLVADVRRGGNHPSAGDIGHRYLLAALTGAGRSDVIFDMENRTDPPSYGAQLAAGATSLAEAWDADPESSQNHCMLGHIEEWFYAGLAGIRPDLGVPGLRRLVIRPEPVGDVSWVKASWETFRGPVVVEWRIVGSVFHLDTDIPPGIQAEVALPEAPGKARPVTQIGSGRYSFEVRDFRK